MGNYVGRPILNADALAAVELITRAAQASGGKEIGGERDKFEFSAPGATLVARFVYVGESQHDGFRYYHFDAEDGRALFVLGSTDLDRKLRADLVGHVLGIVYTHDLDVQQKSPMKSYKVFDFGDSFPKRPADAPAPAATPAYVEDDDLPF